MESILIKIKTFGVGHAHDKNNHDESLKANPNLDDITSAIEAVNCVDQKALCERSSKVIHDHEDGLQSMDTLVNSSKPGKDASNLNDLASDVDAISHSHEKDYDGKSSAINYADGSNSLEGKVCLISLLDY